VSKTRKGFNEEAVGASIRLRYLQEYVVKVAVALDVLKNMLQHHSADSESSIWIQAAERHDVETSLVGDVIDSTTNRADHDIVIVSKLGQLSGLEDVEVKPIIV
jgi:hypothetical protein